MILFVFEGKKTEIKIFDTLKTLYPEKFAEETVICTFCSNIFMLCKEKDALNKDFPGSADLVFLLQEHLRNRTDIPQEYKKLLEIENSDEISEIYLFFDFDIQDNNYIKTLGDKLNVLDKLTKEFCQEDEAGKLYLSYPMVEAFKYYNSPFDSNFISAAIPLSDCNKAFKKKAADYCYDGNLKNFICSGKSKETENANVLDTWNYIAESNAKKANFLCNGKLELPSRTSAFTPEDVFKKQKTELLAHNQLPILSGFGLFLFEY